MLNDDPQPSGTPSALTPGAGLSLFNATHGTNSDANQFQSNYPGGHFAPVGGYPASSIPAHGGHPAHQPEPSPPSLETGDVFNQFHVPADVDNIFAPPSAYEWRDR